jgi:hypothetical protein
LELGKPEKLFPITASGISYPYSPAADGKRFVVIILSGNNFVGVRLMTNWKYALRAH